MRKVVTYYQATAPTPEGIGDIWIDSDDDKTYRWNGTTWENFRDPEITLAVANAANAQASADGKINSYYGPTAPTGLIAADIGDIWVNTVEYNNQYRWNGSSWIDIQDGGISTAITNAAGAQGTADGKVRTFYQTEAPTDMLATDIGDLWVDTNDHNKLYRYSGVVWMSVQDTAVADNIYTANTTTIEGGRITTGSITAGLIRVTGEGAFLPSTIGAPTTGDLATTNSNVSTAQSAANAAQTTANAAQTAAEVASAISGAGYVLPAGVAEAINTNTTLINGAKITTGSLAALSADLGTVTAGKMESVGADGLPDGKFVIDLTNKFISITV